MSDTATGEKKQIRRSEVIERIEARLAGQLAQSALAGWAFDRFYAEELGNEVYEPGAEGALADALDALMFCDDPGFGLDTSELAALIQNLR
ncbi:hypothetical protein F8S13_23390 [Chloroflexia bacterium SDU3-3]|nr:hypothetical protein F8S13_23390 [Chloroflexia bacterium SDU3-3]